MKQFSACVFNVTHPVHDVEISNEPLKGSDNFVEYDFMPFVFHICFSL